MPRSPPSSPDPTPAQRLRLELAVAQRKLEELRREADAVLVAGPVTHEHAAGLAMRLRGLQASVWRIGEEIRRAEGG
jgi:hypothetical protein